MMDYLVECILTEKMKPKATKKVDFYLLQFLLKNSLKLKMHFAIWMMFVTQ